MPPIRGADAYDTLPRNRVLVLLTGSQGEPRAALARLAEDEHPAITLDAGDTLIFSSRTIPGNEKAVNRIVNAMVRKGIEVITDRKKLVHVSGHPRLGELAAMYEWLKPEIAIPVHGEALHLSEHAALARSLGVPQVFTCYDGDVVRLAPGKVEKRDEVPSGRLYRDGNLLIDGESKTLSERRKLAFAGVVSVALALGGRGELAGDPIVEIRGVAGSGRRQDHGSRSCSRRSTSAIRVAMPRRAGAIRMRSRKRSCAQRCAARSARSGARSPCAMCWCARTYKAGD